MDEFNSIPINNELKSEIDEKRSRFLAFAKYVDNSEDAEQFYREKRKEFSDAKHIVFAYRLLNVSRASDDGEPSGTAGRPILQVLEKMNLYNVIVVVVRYFGGVKLGAGPLLRVYSNSVTKVLGANIVNYEKAIKERVQITFAEFESILQMSIRGEIAIRDIEFSDGVTLTIIHPKDKDFNFLKVLSSEEIFYSFKSKNKQK